MARKLTSTAARSRWTVGRRPTRTASAAERSTARALLAQSGHALVGFGTITTAKINFLGDAELRASGGTLAINGTAVENMGVLGTADATGILDLKTSYSNASTDKIEMLGGKIVGAAIANQGVTSGFGTIANQSITNNKTLSAVGGDLVIDTSASVDLDGVLGGVPVVNAVSGDLLVMKPVSDSFAGIANVGGGRRFTSRVAGHSNPPARSTSEDRSFSRRS